MLYKLHGEQSNGKVCLPATNQDIIDYCMANPSIAKEIAELFEQNYFNTWKQEVLQEFTATTGINAEDIDGIEDTACLLYNTGMTNVAEAASELASELIQSHGSSLSVKPTYRGCVACAMLGKGVKFRKSPTHTCGK